MYKACADKMSREPQAAGRYREALPRLAIAMLLATGLAGCGSEPRKSEPESAAAVAAPSAPAASAANKTAVADAATGAAPVELPIPPEAQQQFDSAVASMGSGNLGAAEQAFRALSDNYPAYAGPLLNLAILQAKAGKLEEAEKTLSAAIGRNANSAAAYNQLGIVNRRLGRFKEADEAYQRALQIDPNYALAHLNLGVLCDLYLQQPQRALEAYERYLALASSPDAKVAGWVSELRTRLGAQQRSAKAE